MLMQHQTHDLENTIEYKSNTCQILVTRLNVFRSNPARLALDAFACFPHQTILVGKWEHQWHVGEAQISFVEEPTLADAASSSFVDILAIGLDLLAIPRSRINGIGGTFGAVIGSPF